MELEDLKAIAQDCRDEEKNDHIYVILSSTPLIMGLLIRAVTNYKYNHVSLALSEDIPRMYAFARHYYSAPLCGGFVTESPKRYESHGRYGFVKVFALPVPGRVASAVSELFKDMTENNERYLYNMFSAVRILTKKRVKIKNCYTCAEFGADLIGCAVPEAGITPGRFYTIEQIDTILTDYLFFEGTVEAFVKNAAWENDKFPLKLPLYRAAAYTIRSNARLIKRFIFK
ncbi:MAG: hypothetical protein GX061_02815 [Eubacteriaceae bacterium]|jgi:hypothetical protein|nr:hypothetical protein [Eubacteriaceae bacterium]